MFYNVLRYDIAGKAKKVIGILKSFFSLKGGAKSKQKKATIYFDPNRCRQLHRNARTILPI